MNLNGLNKQLSVLIENYRHPKCKCDVRKNKVQITWENKINIYCDRCGWGEK